MYRPIKHWRKRPQKISDNGYILVYAPMHPKSFDGGWYYAHRIVMEAVFGRLLESYETVHHISEDKTDCSTDNLIVCYEDDHRRINLDS